MYQTKDKKKFTDFWIIQTRKTLVVDKTWNIEHSRTSWNITEHQMIMTIMRKISKMKFSKTEKTSNLEAAMLNVKKFLKATAFR